MIDHAALGREWEEALGRRKSLASSLGFWTVVLEGWSRWPEESVPPLRWSPLECRERWERGVPLAAEADPELPRDQVEELVGPVMEQLAGLGGDAAESLQRFAAAWDGGAVGPRDLMPVTGKDGAATRDERLGLGATFVSFLALAGLRPGLEQHFAATRELPDGIWTPGVCPWCGGMPGYGDLVEDGRRRLSCHLCGGAWIAPRLRCPFCESWESRDLVRLLGEGVDEGYFIEACRSCHGYLKGVDRRQRWNAGSPLVEDWSSPHLDIHAAREGYWRGTPSLAHLTAAP